MADGQYDKYTFTAPYDGRYRVEMTGMSDGSKEGIGNGDGLTLKNLKAGEVYEIRVRQSKGLGYYSLLIK